MFGCPGKSKGRWGCRRGNEHSILWESWVSVSSQLSPRLECATSLMQKSLNGKNFKSYRVLPVQDSALQLLCLRNVEAIRVRSPRAARMDSFPLLI